ncbi:MAG: hypothetical protein EAZ57_00955 [Cytophagales bacterium]|nr:MAG: hypothetical protein EAZ67_00175 [Cytophagales bacterium]TAF62354.1 MAG: hypothetical protein EAZ57_00955 [Cytophagales bacterium]
MKSFLIFIALFSLLNVSNLFANDALKSETSHDVEISANAVFITAKPLRCTLTVLMGAQCPDGRSVVRVVTATGPDCATAASILHAINDHLCDIFVP